MRTRGQLIRNTLLLIAALVLVNLIGQRFKFRWDLTADKRYSLSPATVKLLKELPEAVTVTAYFTENMPPDLAVARQDFKDLLVEYAARSNGNVAFEFVDPNSADSLEQKARDEGIQALLATTRDKDKAENLQIYMGAVVRMGDRKTTIPAIQQGSALEWIVSSAIKEVSILEKPSIGLMQGHGEARPEALSQLVQSLSVMYKVEPMAMFDSVPIHPRFQALLIIDPTDSFPATHLAHMSDYLAGGKGIVLAYSAVKSDLGRSSVAELRHTGLEPWLEQHGIQVQQRIVADWHSANVQVMQQVGNFQLPVQIPFHYFPDVTAFADHPVTSGVEHVIVPFCAPLQPGDTSAARYTPLLFTSSESTTLPSPQMIDFRRPWTEEEFTTGPLTVAAEAEGRTASGSASHLIVFSNGAFCVNGIGQQAMQLQEGNVNVVVNAVDRATGSNDLLGLRGKEVNYRPIGEVSDPKRNLLKWSNLLLPPLLAVAYGLLRRARRARQRRQRMAPGYVR